MVLDGAKQIVMRQWGRDVVSRRAIRRDDEQGNAPARRDATAPRVPFSLVPGDNQFSLLFPVLPQRR